MFTKLLFSILLFIPILSAANEKNDIKSALIIINSKYAENPLDERLNKVDSFVKGLISMGFKVRTIRDGSKDSLEVDVPLFFKGANNSYQMLIVYMGYAVRNVGGEVFWIPVDSSPFDMDERYLKEEGMPLSKIKEEIGKSNSEIKLLVNLACVLPTKNNTQKNKVMLDNYQSKKIFIELSDVDDCDIDTYQKRSEKIIKVLDKNIKNNGRVISFIEDFLFDLSKASQNTIKFRANIVSGKSEAFKTNMKYFDL